MKNANQIQELIERSVSGCASGYTCLFSCYIPEMASRGWFARFFALAPAFISKLRFSRSQVSMERG